MNQCTFALQRCSVGSWAGGLGTREAGQGARGRGKLGRGPGDEGSWVGPKDVFDKLFEEKLSAVHMDIAQKRRKFRMQTFCGFGNT